MGRIYCIVVMLLFAGCSSPQMYPLQPGERITFTSDERADGFRKASGNDNYSKGSVVVITRPTLVQCQ